MHGIRFDENKRASARDFQQGKVRGSSGEDEVVIMKAMLMLLMLPLRRTRTLRSRQQPFSSIQEDAFVWRFLTE